MDFDVVGAARRAACAVHNRYRSIDVDDLAQIGTLAYLEHGERWRGQYRPNPGYPSLQNYLEFRLWQSMMDHGRDQPGPKCRSKRRWFAATVRYDDPVCLLEPADPQPGPADRVLAQDRTRRLEVAVAGLDERERAVMAALAHATPLQDVAERYGVTPGRVSQIKSHALGRLRRSLA